ncbi:stress responsive protein [Desulfosarcina alkanivorans]|uniref:Stress responsive protein n=1 Tax=Desulfosarcina alkanivorans TaxID=571177 RepID=A0A5K7YIK4_9BACT|nr:Dabb family protein [Desulfosarcina alkanivorans]BBO66244.1 stress responsive protein [Desulfosarcina alkanivorans]
MITHVVMMKFKPDVTAEAIDELEALLNRLPDCINEIQSYDFGRDIVRSERSYDFALVSVFANLDTLQHYQAHPEHQVVVKKVGAMCAHIAAVDYENAPYHQKSDEAPDPWKSKTLFQGS